MKQGQVYYYNKHTKALKATKDSWSKANWSKEMECENLCR